MLLNIKNIQKEYDTKMAVKNLSLEVPEGVIYGIIGPNGSGKTTTIRMVMNITMPDQGEILFRGNKINDDFRNKVGYLPEERGLYKKMTCGDVIKYMASLKGCPALKVKDSLDRWLTKVNLLEYKDKKVEELSKGMQQKLQFVSTIIHDPEIIILDEIFSGLDPLNIELIKDVIMDLKREGKTVFFSTHVMEQAEKLCDHICMINNGEKVIDGKLTDVKANYGRNTIQINIDGDGKFVKQLPGVKSLTEYNNYLEIQLEDNNPDTNAILKAMVEKVTVRRFDIVEPSLYDIFIETARIDRDALTTEGGSYDV